MSTTNFPLDTIVRKVDPKGTFLPNQQLIIWEANAGTTLAKEPLVKLFKKISYFAFSDSEVACNTIVYRIMPGVSFDIIFKATCPRGNEGKILASLYQPDEMFEVVLQKKMQVWLKEYIDQNNPSYVLKNIQTVREFIQQKVLTETGLSIIADVLVKNAEHLQPYPIRSKPFPVRMKDYDAAINLSFVTELVLLDGSETLALQRYEALSQQQQQLQSLIEKTIYQSVGINTFYHDLSITVRSLLINELNEYLRSEGRQIFFLELTTDPIVSIAEERLDVECSPGYKIADYSEQITVQSIVAMKLSDIAAYKTAQRKYNITDLSNWVKENVIKMHVKDILFLKKYEDVLVDMDDIKKAIENKIKEGAAAIGYTVMQHVFYPDLKKLEVQRKGFEILLGDRRFLSSDSRVSVALSIKIYGNITNLKELKEKNRRLLLPNVIIEQEMENEIIKTIEGILHKIEPERFFMRFKGNLEEEAVDKILIDTITAELTDKFAVDKSSLKFIIIPMENEVSQKVADLTRDVQEIFVSVSPTLDSPYTEKIDFTILFRIRGVLPTGWYPFQMNLKKGAATEIEEIKKVLGVAVHESLVSCRYQELMSQEHKVKIAIKDHLLQGVFAAVSEKFGLFIEFIDYQRSSTITEQEASLSLENKVQKEEENSRLLLEKEHTSHNTIIDGLSAKRDELLRNGLVEEAEEVNENIKKVQELYKNNLENQGTDIRKIAGVKLTEKNASLSLLDALGNNNKLIENAGNN